MFENWRQFIYTYRILNNLTDDLNRYSLEVVPQHNNSPPMHQMHHNRVPANRSQTKSGSLQDNASRDTRRPPRQGVTPQRPRSTASALESPTPPMRRTQFKMASASMSKATNDSVPEDAPRFVQRHPNQRTPSQRPLSAAPSQGSPVLLQQPTTTPVSYLNNAAVPKSQHTLSKYFQRERGVLGPVEAFSRPPKNDLVQQREQAKNKALQVVAPRHRQPPTNLPSSILSSFLTHPFPSRSLLPPIFRAADTPTTGASAIDESLQSRDPVPLNYFKDGRLVLSGSSIKVGTSLPDHKERLQEDDTAATRGSPSNPTVASDPAASEESTSSDQPTVRQSTADCNDGSRESSPDDASEEIDTWREHFLLEIIKLPYGPSEKEIRHRIRFFHNHSGMTQDELDEARKPYERVCYRQTPRSIEPFEIDGRPETYQLDRIKCWVNFDQHLIGRHPAWPKDYNPVCTKKELLDAELFAQDDDAFSEYTTQSVTASSLA